MKTLVSARRSKFNPWLIGGYGLAVIVVGLLVYGAGWGWYITLFHPTMPLNNIQAGIVIYSWLMAFIAAGVIFIGTAEFFIEEKHKDVYRWWRRKVENYGKIED